MDIIIGFITNNSYLDGIIHRQMRKSLLDSFDRIYILNLHGSARREEKLPPNITKDENVFDIQQGVAITLFIKNEKFKNKKVFYADLYGEREYKYNWLDRNRVNTINWQEIKPEKPYYFFVPKDFNLQREYSRFWKITEIFEEYSGGVKTHRDHFLVGFSENEITARLSRFLDRNLSEEDVKKEFNLRDTRDWKVETARKSVYNFKEIIKRYSYRPFDIRYIAYDKNLIDRGCDRTKLMSNFFRDNTALILNRQSAEFNHILVSENVTDIHFTGGQSYVFPLYLNEGDKKQLNFTKEFIKFIDKKYQNKKVTPEDILSYIYAVLHSPTYREKFNEFLKIDFPRIPFVDDYETFKQLSELGKELVELHLMRKRLPVKTKFDVQGSNVVRRVKYKDGKIFINDKQYFDGIPEDIWNFYIGGYKVLDKWLKSRKNRKLSGKEIEQFLQIVEIIRETIKIMKKIDEVEIFNHK